MICFDNEFKYLTYEILDYTEELDYDLLNYIASNISMLGMYLSYLETQGIKYKVECKPNNKFYINKCYYHTPGNDYPFVILDNKGQFICHACGTAGSIIHFIMEIYKIDFNNALEIIKSFISKTKENLSIENQNIYKELFEFYNLKDEYINISKEKTIYLEKRIITYLKYLESKNKPIDIEKIAKKMCCSKKYVKYLYNKQK